jgi:DNA-binding NarL/FixJ family response regulator
VGDLTTDSAANIHVVVLDDDPDWTASVRGALEHVGRKVLDARDPQHAIALIERAGASLLIIGPTSAQALGWVGGARRAAEALNVVVVVADANAEAAAAFAAGATAVIADTAAAGTLASTLTVAAAESGPRDRFGLSDRELEILEYVTRGLSNAQIARALWVSEQTVKFHLSRIYKKLGVSSRTEAAWVARSDGLVAVRPRSAE